MVPAGLAGSTSEVGDMIRATLPLDDDLNDDPPQQRYGCPAL